jgi:hypothetical protein
MLLLLVLPVIAIVAATHRYVLLYAPSNVLLRRARAAPPTARMVAGFLGSGVVLFLAMHALAQKVAAGAPGWLNILVLMLAWDGIKCGCAALGTAVRCVRWVCSPSR